MRKLCYSAERGHLCPDDLCHGNPDDTLCGFDKSLYDKISSDIFQDEPYEDDEPPETARKP